MKKVYFKIWLPSIISALATLITFIVVLFLELNKVCLNELWLNFSNILIIVEVVVSVVFITISLARTFNIISSNHDNIN